MQTFRLSDDMDVNEFRKQFPFFEHHPDMVYFDSAATSLKPQKVIDTVHEYLAQISVNVHRGDYALARSVEARVEQIRNRIARHIGAEDASDIFFTSGTTDGMEKLAAHWHAVRSPQEHVLVAKDDHASTVTPWLADRSGRAPIVDDYGRRQTGDPVVSDIVRLCKENTSVAVVTHVHNVYGSDANVSEIREAIGSEAFLILDAAQSFGHMRIDVRALGVDALVCSGHKAFADTGIGILYVNRRLREVWRLDREQLESGTLHLSGILSLGAALDVIEEVGVGWIHETLQRHTQRLLARLRAMPKIVHAPGLAFCPCNDGYGILSFSVDGMSLKDVGFILEQNGFLVRTGSHCALPSQKSSDGYVRISMHAYNTEEEIDRLADALERIVT
jgi:cysteine desulfurase/selenocysteine lyase